MIERYHGHYDSREDTRKVVIIFFGIILIVISLIRLSTNIFPGDELWAIILFVVGLIVLLIGIWMHAKEF